MLRLIAVLCLSSTCSVAFAVNGPAVTKAYADSKGRVHIVTADGRGLEIPPEKGQDGVDSIQVAADGKTVGWLIKDSSCCVSYSVPLELVIWRSGHIIRRIQPPMAIWSWIFLNNGKELAYRNSPLHGGWSGECVWVDITTGGNLASWDYPVDENGNDTNDNSNMPDWAKKIP